MMYKHRNVLMLAAVICLAAVLLTIRAKVPAVDD